MSRSPVAVNTAPAPKNSRLLKKEWFRAKQGGGEGERAAAFSPLAWNAMAAQADEDDADILDGRVGQRRFRSFSIMA